MDPAVNIWPVIVRGKYLLVRANIQVGAVVLLQLDYKSREPTWSQWVPLPLVHSETMRDAVKLWKSSKLSPYRIIILEGPHCAVKVAQKRLKDTKQPSDWN